MKISPSYKQLFFVSICILCIFIETYQAIKTQILHKSTKLTKTTNKLIVFLY